MPEDVVARIVERFGLEPLPLEGGLFAQTWRGEERDGRPVGTAILVLLTTAGDHFSAMHRLPIDEVWHFHAGDPIELLLLHGDGSSTLTVFGPDIVAGAVPQVIVPAGTWMGGRVRPGGSWSLFGTTMAPGFVPADYEGGEADSLAAAYPARADLIRALCRPGAALRRSSER